MSNDINRMTRDAALADGISPIRANTPKHYGDRQRQYYAPETSAFIAEYARYSSDFVAAEVQGINGDFSDWKTFRVRFADVVRPTSAIQRNFDDYKMVLFESPIVDYIRPGTKIRTMGNTWLAVNPVNMSGASGNGVFRRCNAVWKSLDYYGNIISEPLIVENSRANANDSDVQQSEVLTKGYFQITCQYNDATRQIDTNTRMILGSAAYRITGYSDFETEFTGDYNTVRLLKFTARYEEPNKTIDDMEHHVAGGLNFRWDISLSGAATMPAETTAQFVATSKRCGAPVVYTQEHPIQYIWESSDEGVLMVDANGKVTAVGEGNAEITARLEQNRNIYTTFDVTVEDVGSGVYFTTTPPESISAYDSTEICAAYFLDGEETDEPLAWTFSGASEGAFSAEIETDGKSATVIGFGYSEKPLTVTAKYGDDSVSAEIWLEGI